MALTPSESSLAPDTTQEEDRRTRAKRVLNLTWEVTQAAIAISLVSAYIAAAFFSDVADSRLQAAFFLVVGFYFGRTNHARPGG
jgi:hypothetical protein